MIAGGTLAGATRPNQLAKFIASKPSSFSVGTSGMSKKRACVVTANTLTFPALRSAVALPAGNICRSVCPPSSDVRAGACPWNGTWSTSSPASPLNVSIAICDVLPRPADE